MRNIDTERFLDSMSEPAVRLLLAGFAHFEQDGVVVASQRELCTHIAMAMKTLILARNELLQRGLVTRTMGGNHRPDEYTITAGGRRIICDAGEMGYVSEAFHRRPVAKPAVSTRGVGHEPLDINPIELETEAPEFAIYVAERWRLAIVIGHCLLVSIKLPAAVVAMSMKRQLFDEAVCEEFFHVGLQLREKGWNGIRGEFSYTVVRSIETPVFHRYKGICAPEVLGLARAGVIRDRRRAMRKSLVHWAKSAPKNRCDVTLVF